jgi:hypothetical protein
VLLDQFIDPLECTVSGVRIALEQGSFDISLEDFIAKRSDIDPKCKLLQPFKRCGELCESIVRRSLNHTGIASFSLSLRFAIDLLF